ncbi:MAG: DUF1800 domain-containing protein [Elstera sp.]
MRLRLLACGLLATGLSALSAHALTPQETRHLLDRAGFGATPQDIALYRPLSRTEAVDKLLGQLDAPTLTPTPEFLAGARPDAATYRAIGDKPAEERRAFTLARQGEALDIRGWWLTEMIHGNSPLRERLALIWHGHFTSAFEKVRVPDLMWRQVALFRAQGTHSFADLLRGIGEDGAMFRYLDVPSSRKNKPNENFARELLELYTLGAGNYSEEDIKEAAKTMVGWRLNAGDLRPVFIPATAVSGPKQVLGETVTELKDVIELLLKQPATARFITEKLWLAFISSTPDSGQVEALAKRFFDSGYQVRPLIRTILLSDAFWSPEAHGRLVKSPVDLVVGTVRRFGMPVKDARWLAIETRLLGQDLLDPPNVRGWPGGMAWITTDSLLKRRAVLTRLAYGEPPEPANRQPDGIAAQYARLVGLTQARPSAASQQGRAEPLSDFFAKNPLFLTDESLLQTSMLAEPPVQPPTRSARADRLLELLLDPAYQVK